MRKIWKFVVFFLLCLIVALSINMPVQHVLSFVKLPNTVRLIGIDGSVFSGKTREVGVNQFPFHNVKYRFQPSCILLLQVCYQINYDRGEANVAYSLLGGATEVTDGLVSYKAAELIAQIPNLLVKPSGRLELEIDQLSLQQGKPQVMKGRLTWRELSLDDQSAVIKLGDYQLDFVGNPLGYEFEVMDLGASLKVNGDGKLSSNGQYVVDVKISSETAIDSKIKSMLDLFAKSTSYNKYRIEQTGRVPPQVIRQLF